MTGKDTYSSDVKLQAKRPCGHQWEDNIQQGSYGKKVVGRTVNRVGLDAVRAFHEHSDEPSCWVLVQVTAVPDIHSIMN